MKIFNKPKNLNGDELIAELKSVGIEIENVYDFSDGTIGFDTNDEELAKSIVEAHNGTVLAPQLTITEKLNKVGLNIDDLKAVLGS